MVTQEGLLRHNYKVATLSADLRKHKSEQNGKYDLDGVACEIMWVPERQVACASPPSYLNAQRIPQGVGLASLSVYEGYSHTDSNTKWKSGDTVGVKTYGLLGVAFGVSVSSFLNTQLWG